MDNKKTVAETNREYWNSKNNFYESNKEWADDTADRFAMELRTRREWLGLPETKTGNLRLLDVACGPGMISNALFDFFDEARGIDIADSMVEKYNKRSQEKGLFPAQMTAFQGNIVAADPTSQANISGQEFFNFDVVCMANALHHMEDPALAIDRLMQRLRPGGTLLIIEFLTDSDVPTLHYGSEPSSGHHGSHGHHTHGHGHSQGGREHGHGDMSGKEFGAAHVGFTLGRLRKLFDDAGCLDVDTVVLEEPVKFPASLGSIERTSCFARGRKAQ